MRATPKKAVIIAASDEGFGRNAKSTRRVETGSSAGVMNVVDMPYKAVVRDAACY
jgi:hypothetical protein